MHVTTLFPLLAMAVTVVNADGFSPEDQAIWIDRHNYFRTTGLPWSAGNMRRIGWDANLATTAASTAAKCSATTSAGMNVFQFSSGNSSDIIDDAIQEWVVETSVETLSKMAQPGSSGQGVGAGVYNSYSQVLWSSTTSVGCAAASCSSGQMVVCQYSPAGNDGSSPWYIHATQGSQCPSGTTSSGGLCIVEGDAANNQIASIPAGEQSYQIYPAYVADIQTILIENARGIAKGSTSTTGPTTAPTPAPVATTTPPSTTKPPTSKTTTDGSSEDESTKQESSTKQETSQKTTTSSSTSETQEDISIPGTVKASSADGSKFANEAKSPSTQENTPSGSTTATTAQNAESSTTSTAEGGLEGKGLSTLGLVGMFIVGVGAVAGIVIFVHYRSSMRQQNDILLDGGIRR
ncbi:hypothetical protein PHYBOEH_003351 [Phytophthora boehmeriae]|uniref:SCP domain-containing protein n=1 Tax=Phytophthora boehmeriae TaxID=109152 RepID=A0A8T1WNS6_9STRA|nr:hypothetical protein PHYBOEH_003351 [Phytophthora boehmeriae]